MHLKNGQESGVQRIGTQRRRRQQRDTPCNAGIEDEVLARYGRNGLDYLANIRVFPVESRGRLL